MYAMFRLRRYRYYVFFAAIVVFLLYRVAQNSDHWESVSVSLPHTPRPSSPKSPPPSKPASDSQVDTSFEALSSPDDHLPQRILDSPAKGNSAAKLPDLPELKSAEQLDSPAKGSSAAKIPDPPEFKSPKQADDDEGDHDDAGFEPAPDTEAVIQKAGVLAYDHDEASKATTAPIINVPDKNVGQGAKDPEKKPVTTTPHWKKVPENFPVPKSEIIPLPTGKPKKIPAVQYAFGKEPPETRELREARQQQVKAEMARGWAGYWKYARGHDELSPVTKTFRDPFCGWAATLVDSLDTLWIMGMEEEFAEALAEVEKIDFTTSKRPEIPVFETTIRYLGGLIAAYDVSGGKTGRHDILLTKAVELAEILMGVFDTPNRMPVLYYNWKPEYASQPTRASTSAGVAELGSLAMEFTRLAQITKENKYYDAVARITEAFYEWQERGTSIPGIFPEHVDASGCNRTAQSELEAAQDAVEEETYGKTDGDEDQSAETTADDDDLDLESDVEPNSRHDGADKGKSSIVKRSRKSSALNLNVTKKKNPKTGKVELVAGKTTLPECVSQGLTSGGWGADQYSMGGSQDSTYEYFPKQWLLLGGLEPKYKELHLKVSEAVKKWLLYRPMVPYDRDILFSAKVVTNGEPETDASTQYEVTHLTCFLGGMFGLGGKIFEVPADVEIGKKLTEGCVWAYESTATGIMPEGAHVLPCADAKNCHWNQTLYERTLDPSFNIRDEQVEEYYKRKAKTKAATEEGRERKKAEQDLASSSSSSSETGHLEKSTFDENPSRGSPAGYGSARIHKRAPVSAVEDTEDDETEGSLANKGKAQSHAAESLDLEGSLLTTKGRAKPHAAESIDLEDSDRAPEFKKSAASQLPLQEDKDEDEDEEDPLRPLSHEEYLANKIKNENLPKGFLDVNSRAYILR